MASAVSNAGSLDTITALNFSTPAALCGEIRRYRRLTPNPFAVNITLLPNVVLLDYYDFAQVAINKGVTIVKIVGNSSGSIIS
ncbi:hypothetical protein EDB80DRAFT_583369 [Ilyonectria destructans]|nr:hypothetical protein EDB80DRAFT_583369 [Ilyonectria destructans]